MDRFILGGDWTMVDWMVEAEILPINGSDHFLISLRIQEECVPNRCPFKFEAMWLRENGFK